MPRTQKEPVIYLQRDAGKRLQRIFNCDSNSRVAAIIGIDQGHYHRIAVDGDRPGMKFAARLLRATRGRASFEDLFEVVDEDASVLRRAS